MFFKFFNEEYNLKQKFLYQRINRSDLKTINRISRGNIDVSYGLGIWSDQQDYFPFRSARAKRSCFVPSVERSRPIPGLLRPYGQAIIA